MPTNFLPVVAFNIVLLLKLPIELVVKEAPGGVTSNVLTKFANGDVALRVLTTIMFAKYYFRSICIHLLIY